MLMKCILPEASLDLCTDILAIWGFMVYILNSSFPLNPILISMFHNPNLLKTLNRVLCKDVAKSGQENFILVCISPLLYLKPKKLLHDKKKISFTNKRRSASLRCALYREYSSLLYGALQSGQPPTLKQAVRCWKTRVSSFLQHDVYLTVQENKMFLRSIAFLLLTIPSISLPYTLNEHE